MSERFEETYQSVAVGLGHLGEKLSGSLPFSAMPHDGLREIAGSAVVEEVGVSVDLLLQTYPPERGRAPFIAHSQSGDIVVVETNAHDFRAHVVEKEVGIRMDCLASEPRKTRAVEQGGA